VALRDRESTPEGVRAGSDPGQTRVRPLGRNCLAEYAYHESG
jgi:hypothetical protein